ncbi:MAG: hypothetical protein ACI814_001980 [Mariniblastus sp.]|jgi:hypothetical protein
MSVLFHTSLFAILLLALTQIQNGAGTVENRTGGIVLVNAASLNTEYLSEGDAENDSSSQSSADSPPPLAANDEQPPDLPGFESSTTRIEGVGESLTASLPGAESLIDGPEFNGKIGGKVTTEIFGVKGTGSRFVYVIDRSESMLGPELDFRPMLAARQQILESLNSLEEIHQFQIVFYNHETRVFQTGTGMHYATQQNKEIATSFIIRTKPEGGTDHLQALLAAFKFSPDVIFFLTDAEGGFSARDLADISDRNRSVAVINAIEFGERRGRNRSLEAVARESGGQYVFKNINTLRLENK